MASPQKENGYTPVANEILENVTKLPLNGTQYKIVLTVWRSTYGYQKKSHALSLNYLANACNCSKAGIKKELKVLFDYNILTESDPATFNTPRGIAFNKNYDTYRVTNVPQSNDDNIPQGNSCNTLQGNNSYPKKEIYKNNINKDVQMFFENIWKLYPIKKGKGSVSKTQITKLYGIGLEEIERAINRYINEMEGTDKQYWKHGSTFFNSGYVDYLDANYEEKPKEQINDYGLSKLKFI